MRVLAYLIQKEFLQIFRNRSMLPIIVFLPIVQLLILANAATFDIRNIKLAVLDHDHSSTSRALRGHFEASPEFEVGAPMMSEAAANEALRSGHADIVLVIPAHFERAMARHETPTVQVLVDAIDGAAAGVITSYVVSILAAFNAETQPRWITVPTQRPEFLRVNTRFWFNPELRYTTYMVPGILALLVTIVAMFLAGMNIVRERELGTIEQINVTPIRRWQFIVGKLLPFWFLGLFELAFGLLIARVVFHIIPLGSLLLLFAFAAIYLSVVLGIGLFISSLSETQQQAMFIAWFFMVIFILMSGLFTPIESMPVWAQRITLLNPVAYFVKVMRLVMLKGAGFREVWQYFAALSAFSLGINTLAVRSYRKTR